MLQQHNDFILKIADIEIRNLFLQIWTCYEFDFSRSTNFALRHYYDVMNYINLNTFDSIAEINYIKMALFSDPSAMVLKIKDEAFLKVIEDNWSHITKRADEKGYLTLIDTLIHLYPQRFYSIN